MPTYTRLPRVPPGCHTAPAPRLQGVRPLTRGRRDGTEALKGNVVPKGACETSPLILCVSPALRSDRDPPTATRGLRRPASVPPSGGTARPRPHQGVRRGVPGAAPQDNGSFPDPPRSQGVAPSPAIAVPPYGEQHSRSASIAILGGPPSLRGAPRGDATAPIPAGGLLPPRAQKKRRQEKCLIKKSRSS